MQVDRDVESRTTPERLRAAASIAALLAAPSLVAARPPSPAAPAAASAAMISAVVARNRPTVVEHYVDLNSASRKELMTLPGIGAREAALIVAKRPYLTKTELVSKSVLPVGPFLSLRHLVVAMPPATAQASH